MDTRDEQQLLRDAQAKAQKLVDRLIAQRDDLERSGLALAPEVHEALARYRQQQTENVLAHPDPRE